MKLCVISTPVFVCPPPGYSGLEQLAWQQAKGLAERGHQVSLIAPDNSTCPNVEIIAIGPAGQIDERAAYDKYWKRLLEFDVIIDHSWTKHAYLLKAEGVLKAPVLGVTHAPVDTMLRSLPPGVAKPCFVCISKDQASHFEGLFGRKAEVAYNGFDATFYKLLNIPRTDRFLFLARFSTIKGPDICQDVCKAVGVGLDLIGDVKITGEPQYLEDCKRKADGKQIKIIGGVSRGECVYWFSQARAFLHLNKRFREPFGLAPVEAQACGNAVLCWNYGAMKETVKHGETGFLVNSEDEAIEVLKSGVLDQINRDHCREWAMQFSYENFITRYEELCIQAVNSGGW